MARRTAITLIVLLALAGGHAQDAPSVTSLDARLAIVERQLDRLNGEVGKLAVIESRLARVELDLSKLAAVPTALARIEEKVTSLADKSDSLGGNISTVVIAVLTMVLGSVTGAAWQARKTSKA